MSQVRTKQNDEPGDDDSIIDYDDLNGDESSDDDEDWMTNVDSDIFSGSLERVLPITSIWINVNILTKGFNLITLKFR